MRAYAMVLAVAISISAPAVRAQEATTTDTTDLTSEAQALFRRGLALGEENRWADALEHFRRSYARVARPSTLFNIGVALGRLGRFVEAIETFDQILAGTEALPPGPRAEAERLRAEAVASLGELTVAITPASAALAVDGVVRVGEGSPRTLPLDPGRHVLRATAADHNEAVLEVSVVAGERAERSVTLVALEAARPDPIITPQSTSLFDDPVFWIVGGVLVVAIGVGVGVGVGVASTPPPQYGGTTGIVLLAP